MENKDEKKFTSKKDTNVEKKNLKKNIKMIIY